MQAAELDRRYVYAVIVSGKQGIVEPWGSSGLTRDLEYHCETQMKTGIPPRLVPTRDLPYHFHSNGIAYTQVNRLNLGFGSGNDQYRLYPYPGPADDETMGVFCELHTENYFEVDTSPHIAIGMRGPLKEDPHRGRGLAIGILANRMANPEDPDHPIELFKGCPDAPGGPSFFIEDFTINEGTRPITEWQLSRGHDLPQLRGNSVYRLDIHVSSSDVWAGVWKVTNQPSDNDLTVPVYTFLGQTACSADMPACSGNPDSPCPEDELDRGKGNVFIGSGFSDPETRAWIDNIYIAHWKHPPQRPLPIK